MTDYADLEIGLFAREPGTYTVELRFNQPGSEADIRLGQTRAIATHFDFDLLKELEYDPGSYGKALAEAVFADVELRVNFARARAAAETQQLPLRLRLLIGPDAPELHNLRWETLVDLDSPLVAFLFTSENLLFSRYLSSLDWRPVQPPAKAQLQALVVIANPSDLPNYKLAPIDVAREIERAQRSLQGISVVTLPGAEAGEKATLDLLADQLRHGGLQASGFDVLYLVCHGAQIGHDTFLWLEGNDGKANRIAGSEFIASLNELRRLPLMAVLIACQSAGKAEGPALAALGPRLVETGIPAVLAMQGNLSMATEARFMPQFCQELISDGEIDRALAVARSVVRAEQDWWVPVLFSRLRDNQLFVVPHGIAVPKIPTLSFEPETIYIPAGAFLMGSSPGDGILEFETPQHQVVLPAYRIGKYPVTNKQYAEFIRQTRRLVSPEMEWEGQNPTPGTGNHPVMGVTWFDALAYCDWLSKQTGRSYSIPNEAEWEKAARGTDGRSYPWGDKWEPGLANQGSGQVVSVDHYPAQSVYGCYDMVGNVREWTCSLWGEKRLEPIFRYPWTEDGRNDLLASNQVYRVHRGGSFVDEVRRLTCTSRFALTPDKPGPPGKRLGFRVVLRV